MFPLHQLAFIGPSSAGLASTRGRRNSPAARCRVRPFLDRCVLLVRAPIGTVPQSCPGRSCPVALAKSDKNSVRDPPSAFAVLLGFCTCCAALITIVPMIILHPVVLLFDKRRRAVHEYLALKWLRLSFALAGVRVRVQGTQNLKALRPERAALFVSNCQSPIDMFALAFLKRRMRFIVPEAALRAPLVGWIMSLAGWVGLSGTDRRGQMNALKRATSVVEEEGGRMCMFPEGSPSPSGRMSPFSAAAFRAATKAGVPVVPVTTHGTGAMFDPEGVVPARRPPGGISVTVHPPIDPGAGDEKTIADLAFQAVQGALPESVRV